MTLEKNLTARPLYVRKKEFYHQWVWGKTFFPRQITHTTHGTPPTPINVKWSLFLPVPLLFSSSVPSLPNVPLFLCSSCFVPC